jgi:hypothetical protein
MKMMVVNGIVPSTEPFQLSKMAAAKAAAVQWQEPIRKQLTCKFSVTSCARTTNYFKIYLLYKFYTFLKLLFNSIC